MKMNDVQAKLEKLENELSKARSKLQDFEVTDATRLTGVGLSDTPTPAKDTPISPDDYSGSTTQELGNGTTDKRLTPVEVLLSNPFEYRGRDRVATAVPQHHVTPSPERANDVGRHSGAGSGTPQEITLEIDQQGEPADAEHTSSVEVNSREAPRPQQQAPDPGPSAYEMPARKCGYPGYLYGPGVSDELALVEQRLELLGTRLRTRERRQWWDTGDEFRASLMERRIDLIKRELDMPRRVRPQVNRDALGRRAGDLDGNISGYLGKEHSAFKPVCNPCYPCAPCYPCVTCPGDKADVRCYFEMIDDLDQMNAEYKSMISRPCITSRERSTAKSIKNEIFDVEGMLRTIKRRSIVASLREREGDEALRHYLTELYLDGALGYDRYSRLQVRTCLK